MARRADPARILEAQRAGTRQRLLGLGWQADRVDGLMAAWEAAPESQSLPRDGRYWDAAFEWIVAQRQR